MSSSCGNETSQQIIDHYNGVRMSAMASQITRISTVCSNVCSGAHQGGHKNSALLAFVRGIHWSPLDSHHKGSVTRKMIPFDDVIMATAVFITKNKCKKDSCHVYWAYISHTPRPKEFPLQLSGYVCGSPASSRPYYAPKNWVWVATMSGLFTHVTPLKAFPIKRYGYCHPL